MSPFQAKPDASETCNYSWLPPPAAIAPVPFQDTSWSCLAFCLRNPKPVDQAHLPIEREKNNSKEKKQYNEAPPSLPPSRSPQSLHQVNKGKLSSAEPEDLHLICMADKARGELRPQPCGSPVTSYLLSRQGSACRTKLPSPYALPGMCQVPYVTFPLLGPKLPGEWQAAFWMQPGFFTPAPARLSIFRPCKLNPLSWALSWWSHSGWDRQP